ncbi:ABC transporter substrate-binding protein [Candidatus Kaiserbacteria bacterium]|nr:ABC transporter substrate-binding protein [Candidatus Kaiserbacteria bacterium]
MKKRTLTILILIILGAGGYLLWGTNHNNPDSLEAFSVRLSWVHQAQFAGLYVAKEKGFYEDVGLDVSFLSADVSITQTDEVAAGAVDASIMEAHQFLADEVHINDLEAVAAIYQVNPHVLAARADSAITGPEDFSGKMIGLAGGKSEGTALFETFIDSIKNGQSVTYTELGFDTVDDFLNRRADIIDVYRIDQPYRAAEEGIPLTIIPLDAYGFSTYGDVVVMNKGTTEGNPDRARRFVQATLRGWEYALEYPEEAVDITLAYAEGEYYDRAYQEHILFESIPLVRGEASVLGTMELVPWSTLYESMRRAGVITMPFNVNDVYTNEFIH